MDWESVGKAKAIFERLLDIPPEEREGLILQFCEADELLSNQVRDLLRAHAASENYLSRDLPEQFTSAREDASLAGLQARRIGPYQIVRPLGRGGMASVYLARRTDGLYPRDVALKVVDRSFSAADTELRFQRELKALSKLTHSNIVRMMDGGITENGLLFVVMEYVDGKPANSFCRDQHLDTRQRLRLFLQVCDAVAFAHRNLVVHRDIKPSNVLVTESGTAKLLDFGVAKLLDEEPAEGYTLSGFNRLTLEYASPEQVRGEQNVSTSTDIYSLGVLLYELIVGRLPYELRGQMPHEVARVVLEDEPLPPAGVPKELAAVLMMALRKEPDRRYASADALRDDLERYLNGLPVKAFPDSSWYRFKKIVQRRKRSVAAAAIASIAILAASGAAFYQAEKANERLRQLTQFSETVLFKILPQFWGIPGALTARVVVTQKSIEYIDMLLKDRNDLNARRQLIYTLLINSSDLSNLYGSHIGDTRGARQVLERALSLAEEEWRRNPNSRDETHNLVHSLNYLARNLIERGEPAKARKLLERAVTLKEAILVGKPAREADHELLARSLSLVGVRYAADGEPQRSIDCHRRALAMRETDLSNGRNGDAWHFHKLRRHRSEDTFLFAGSLYQLGLLREALVRSQAALQEERDLLNDDKVSRVTRFLIAQRLALNAEIQLKLRELQNAESNASEALEVFRALSIAERTCWGSRRGIVTTLGLLASIQEAKGDAAAAVRTLQAQLPLATAAADHDVESARAKQDVERCGKQLARLTAIK
jgi:eukaryotic-like serine/threonine-protein kinase